MTKQIVSFQNFVNATKNLSSYHIENTVLLHYNDQLMFTTENGYCPYETQKALCGQNEFLNVKKSGVKFTNYSFFLSS